MAWNFELSKEFRDFLPSVEDGEWMPCPRCGSRETVFVDNRKVSAGLLITAISFGVLGLLLPFLWVIAALTGAAWIGSLLGPVWSSNRRHWSCKRCKLEWNWTRVEYVKSKM